MASTPGTTSTGRPPEPLAGSSSGGAQRSSSSPPPLTSTALARLFGVPLLIVIMIIGSAVVVVLLFGSISTERERGVNELLSLVEREPVGKVLDLALMPQDKEIWQAAKELAARLQRKDVELAGADLDLVVKRLIPCVDRELALPEPLKQDRRQLLFFFLGSLSATGRPESIAPIAKCLHSPSAETRREALKALGQAHATPGVETAKPAVLAALDDEEPTVRTVAAFVLTFLGNPNDATTIARLQGVCQRAEEDREVRWNAALTLARLGSDACRETLLEMLDRRYWEEHAPVRLVGDGGAVAEQPMPPGQVNAMMRAAIEAAAQVNDEGIRRAVRDLADDPSLLVREAARKASDSMLDEGEKTKESRNESG